MTGSLDNGQRFRVLMVVDQFSRMSPLVEADLSMSGPKVVVALERVCRQ